MLIFFVTVIQYVSYLIRLPSLQCTQRNGFYRLQLQLFQSTSSTHFLVRFSRWILFKCFAHMSAHSSICSTGDYPST